MIAEPMEEVKGGDPIGDIGQDSDPEGSEEDLAAESKLLQDIYGSKIKKEVRWLFESPVVMVERDKIG